MPTIHYEGGFYFRIFMRDHPPPHVHAFNADGFVKIELGDSETRPHLKGGRGMKPPAARRTVGLVEKNQEAFLRAWDEIHGT